MIEKAAEIQATLTKRHRNLFIFKIKEANFVRKRIDKNYGKKLSKLDKPWTKYTKIMEEKLSKLDKP